MGIPTSIFQLRRKRNEIRDAIASYEVKLREARADLAAVLSTLRLFEVTGDPADLAPYMDLNRLFRRGETTELCLAALQEEGELDTRELTARVMAAKGLPSVWIMAQSSNVLASWRSDNRAQRVSSNFVLRISAVDIPNSIPHCQGHA